MLLCTILQKLELHESSFTGVWHKDPRLCLKEWYNGGEINGNQLPSAQREDNYQETPVLEAMEKGTLLCTAAANSDLNKVRELLRCGADANLIDANGRTALHAAVQKGHIDLIKMLLEHGANMHKPDPRGWTPKAMVQEHGKNDICELLLSYEKRKRLFGDDQRQTASSNQNSPVQSNWEWNTAFRYPRHVKTMTTTCSESESHSDDNNNMKLNSRRVTIHMHPQKSDRSPEQFGKLINLPGSLQELLRIGGKYCLLCKTLTQKPEIKMQTNYFE